MARGGSVSSSMGEMTPSVDGVDEAIWHYSSYSCYLNTVSGVIFAKTVVKMSFLLITL